MHIWKVINFLHPKQSKTCARQGDTWSHCLDILKVKRVILLTSYFRRFSRLSFSSLACDRKCDVNNYRLFFQIQFFQWRILRQVWTPFSNLSKAYIAVFFTIRWTTMIIVIIFTVVLDFPGNDLSAI